jgi:hypothetical protein
VGDAPGVHQLADDPAVGRVHGVGDLAPPGDLLARSMGDLALKLFVVGGAPRPDHRHACSPIGSASRRSRHWVWMTSRVLRACALAKSAWSAARLTGGPAPGSEALLGLRGRPPGCRRGLPSGCAGDGTSAGGRRRVPRPDVGCRARIRARCLGGRSTASRRGSRRNGGTCRGRSRGRPVLRPGGAGAGHAGPARTARPEGVGQPGDALAAAAGQGGGERNAVDRRGVTRLRRRAAPMRSTCDGRGSARQARTSLLRLNGQCRGGPAAAAGPGRVGGPGTGGCDVGGGEDYCSGSQATSWSKIRPSPSSFRESNGIRP